MSYYSVNVTTDLAGIPGAGLSNLANDGSDTTAALQALFNYVSYAVSPTHPMVLEFPAGRYGLSSTVILGPNAGAGGMCLRGISGPCHRESPFIESAASTVRFVPLSGWIGASLFELRNSIGVMFENLTWEDLLGYGHNGSTPLTSFVKLTDTGGSSGAETFNQCSFISYLGHWGEAVWHANQTGVAVTGTTGGSNNMFRHCAFTGLEYGYLNQNAQAYWNRFEHNRFYNCMVDYQFEKCLKHTLISDLTAGDNWYIRVGGRMSGNINGLLVEGLAQDSKNTVRTKWFWQAEQGEYGTPVTGGQGSDLGVVRFSNCNAAQGWGRLQGVSPAIASNGAAPAKCRLTLDVPYLSAGAAGSPGTGWTKLVAGEKIRCVGFAESTYNVVHTITEVQQQGKNNYLGATSQSLIVDTDIAYISAGSGTKWLEAGAVFRQRGGGMLVVEDCWLGNSWDASGISIQQDYGRLIDQQPGDYYYGHPSRAIFSRCQGIYSGFAPTLAELDYSAGNTSGVRINGDRPYRSGCQNVAGWTNWIKFLDCYTVAIIGHVTNDPNWTTGNFGMDDATIKQLRYRLHLDGTTQAPAGAMGTRLSPAIPQRMADGGATSAEVLAGSTTTSVITNLPQRTGANHWRYSAVVFATGALKGIPRKVTDSAWDGTKTILTVSPACPVAPANGDQICLIGYVE